MRLSLIAVICAASLVTACGRSVTQPDGGRDRINCTDDFDFVPVTVRDSTGAPVKDATVTARHVGTGATQEGVTNDQGLTTVVNEDLQGGSIEVRATAGTKQSTVGQIELICGECTCVGEPNSLLLTIPL